MKKINKNRISVKFSQNVSIRKIEYFGFWDIQKTLVGFLDFFTCPEIRLTRKDGQSSKDLDEIILDLVIPSWPCYPDP